MSAWAASPAKSRYPEPSATNGAGYSLKKVGTDTLVLANAESYSGGTTILGGILQIGNGGSVGSLVGSVLDSASLVFMRGDYPIFSGAISGAGSVTQAGAGTLTLNGANTYTGATIVTGGGTLSIGAGQLGTTSLVSVGNTSIAGLNLYSDNTGAAVNLASGTNLILGGTASAATLGFQVGGASAYDSLNLSGGGAVTVGAGGLTIEVSALPGFGAGVYTLISAPGGISGGAITLPFIDLPTGYNYALGKSSTAVTLTVTAAPSSGNAYWTGSLNKSWSASNGGNTNFSSDNAGSLNFGFTPGAGDTVGFQRHECGREPDHDNSGSKLLDCRFEFHQFGHGRGDH